MAEAEFTDYYEVLMVSTSADRGMLEWATPLMRTRYGKKGGKTADPEKYALVKKAKRSRLAPTPGRETPALDPESIRLVPLATKRDVEVNKILRLATLSTL